MVGRESGFAASPDLSATLRRPCLREELPMRRKLEQRRKLQHYVLLCDKPYYAILYYTILYDTMKQHTI
eukprot:8680386-Heterocapsa_arctica.AAC.1